MTMTDTTADFLTRIRNGLRAQHDAVEAPASRLSAEIARILVEQGYIEGYEMRERDPRRAGDWVVIRLRYTDDQRPVISGLERVSRPGRRRYVDHDSVPRVHGGTGTAIVSTSRGVMTGHEATARRVGGEVVAYVW